MMRLRGSVLLGALACSTVATVSVECPAQAQPSPLEAEHQRGLRLLRENHAVEAIEVFRGLYDRAREPRALWRQGVAESALGRWVEAEEHMRAAFESSTDPWVSSQRAGLEEDLRQVQARVGAIDVRCSAPGAVVSIDERRVQRFPARVVAGAVRVTVSAPGYEPLTERLTVPGRVDPPFRWEAVLRRTATAVVSAPVTPPSGPAIVTAVPSGQGGAFATPLAPRTPPSGSRSNTLRTVGWVTLGVGVAGLGTGLVGALLRGTSADDFNANPSCGEDERSRGGASCQGLYERVGAMQTLATVGWIVGGLGVAAGVVMIALPSRAATVDRRAQRGWWIASGPGQIGLGIGSRW